MLIQLPENLEPNSLANFAVQLHNLSEDREYIFDFGQRRRFPPFSMLFLSSIIKSFREARPSSQRRAINHENHSYAAHFGFFRSFGLKHGNEPGEAPGGASLYSNSRF